MNDLQLQASNPSHSVWVSASAGTGKTKILTDRVLRLLINNIEFKKILCLTFTNAASCEMQKRISSTLANFAKIDEASLRNQLHALLGKYPTTIELNTARTVCHRLSDNDDKLNIYTIHSFCQKILKSFPLEAGVNPAFRILDEITVQEVMQEIKTKLILDNDSADSVNFFLTNCHETVLDGLLDQILAQKLRFKNVGQSELISRFSINNDTILYSFQNQDNKSFFLTKDGKKRKNLGRKYTAEILQQQDLVYKLDQQNKLQVTVEYSEHLMKLARVFLNYYEEYKFQHSLLDYDDLIFYALKLLTNNSAKEWVLYKLDGGIDHLLVDEAQDTSREQWQIIEAIISEFYSGDGISQKKRTIFVVGDEKQSIFSFQGADLSSFSTMNQLLKEKLLSAKKDFKVINLEHSYRSTIEILDSVYSIFERIKALYPELFPIPNIKITPHKNYSGKVELWPLVISDKNEELSWPMPDQYNNSISSKKRLAIKIAEYIKTHIDQKIILPSTNLPARSEDFMILVRKRDDFTIEIINQLRNLDLDVLGIDRMLLKDNLSVLDLIAAAKFALNPKDDLNLACLLRSPIIDLGISDLELLRTFAVSLWDSVVLKKYEPSIAHAYNILNMLIDIYQHTNNDFFAVLIDRINYRDALGSDNIDAINEFLYLISNYNNTTIGPSLQGFVYWFDANEIEIKKNIENVNKIKVMTVHGAKGLQAPVVILCDTTSVPTNQSQFFWINDKEVLAAMNADSTPQLLKDIKEQEYQKELQEYIRLLYVGLTRACDQLIICGYSNSEKLPKYCWYELVACVIPLLEDKDMQAQVIAKPHTVYNEANRIDTKLMSWSQGENKTLSHTSDNATNHYYSPLKSKNSLEYGRILHKILDDSAKAKNINLLKTHPLINTLPETLQTKVCRNIDSLLVNTDFSDLFSQDIRTEVSIGALEDGAVKLFRIDLLAIRGKDITIIDYKSDINPPIDNISVPLNYIQKLHAYKSVVQKIYPQHNVICKILWLGNNTFSIF